MSWIDDLSYICDVMKDMTEVLQVGSRCGDPGQGFQASYVASSSRQGVDDGVHGLTVRVQSLSVGDQVRILTNFVQPATQHVTWSNQETNKAIAV